MKVSFFVLGALTILCGCSRSQAEYAKAVEAEWSAEREDFAKRAAFYEQFAADFGAGAARAQRIANKLGSGSDIAEQHRGVADGSRAKAEDARYFSKASFVRLKELHCANAVSLSGENCEVTFVVRGPDGKEADLSGAYRFDKRQGKLEVVGPVEAS